MFMIEIAGVKVCVQAGLLFGSAFWW
jgi:hypothetical protein